MITTILIIILILMISNAPTYLLFHWHEDPDDVWGMTRLPLWKNLHYLRVLDRNIMTLKFVPPWGWRIKEIK